MKTDPVVETHRLGIRSKICVGKCHVGFTSNLRGIGRKIFIGVPIE